MRQAQLLVTGIVLGPPLRFGEAGVLGNYSIVGDGRFENAALGWFCHDRS